MTTCRARLCECSDHVLAQAAAGGDQAAFGELARRYQRLIGWAARRPLLGQSEEDLRQAALLGLYEACRVHDRRRGAFGALATSCVVNHVRREQQLAGAGKQRVLSFAASLDARRRSADSEAVATLGEQLGAPESADPARVVEAREQLEALCAAMRALSPRRRAALLSDAKGRLASNRRSAARRRLQQLIDHPPEPPQPAVLPSFTAAQVQRAVRLVRAGASVGHAAFVVGADKATVTTWLEGAA